MKPNTSFIADALSERSQKERLRTLKTVAPQGNSHITLDGTTLINVCSNDYLGLAMHPSVIEASVAATYAFGAGSTSSRLVSGSYPLIDTLESELAAWLGRESVLLFNSGFQMNTSLIAAIADKNTNLFYDKRNHNSLLQGALLSRANLYRYRHADAAHLEELLSKHADTSRKNIIITESVFSMDGDVPDLAQISALADQFNAFLIVDEAHAVGACSTFGKGFTFGNNRVDLVIGTFGKAFGSFGAFAACSSEMRDYLINYCPGFIYTTALPPSVVGAILQSLRLMPTLAEERTRLEEVSAWFRSELIGLGLDTSGSSSHIVPVVIGEDAKAVEISERLRKAGFFVQAIRPPTVEEGRARLRFTMTSNLTKDMLKPILEVLANK